MKLIATRSFRNVPSLRLKEDGKTTISDAKHNDHIHRGAVFEIGDTNLKLNNADLQKLRKSDSAAAEVVALLVHAEAVADANDPEAVAKVKAAIEEDNRRAANAAKLDQTAAGQSLVVQLLTALKSFNPKTV